MTLPFHPLAEIFPLMEGKAFDALVASIKANGLREAIVIFERKVLDGRNRERACAVAGIGPAYEPFCGDDPVAFVVDANLHRRHLNESQRAMVAAKLASLKRGDNQHSPIGGTSQAEAAARLKVGKRSVERAAGVRERGAPELVQAVERGDVRVSVAADIATELPEQQREIVARGEKEILTAARAIRARRAEQSHDERIEKLAKIAEGNRGIPIDRRFPVILADPPWHFEAYNETSGVERAAGNHYPTMALDEICALPVKRLATDSAALFLWTTAPHLHEAIRVIEAWGFGYRTNICWVKNRFGLGYYVRNQHELLLVATRGDMPAPAPSRRPSSVIMSPKREHSRKPDEAYELIERMYPDLPKIELFARGEARPGWAAWGNQAPGATGPASREDPGEMPDIPDFLRRPLPQEHAPSEGRR
jgi:N6-adenosine-specific RNA methylase IME4